MNFTEIKFILLNSLNSNISILIFLIQTFCTFYVCPCMRAQLINLINLTLLSFSRPSLGHLASWPLGHRAIQEHLDPKRWLSFHVLVAAAALIQLPKVAKLPQVGELSRQLDECMKGRVKGGSRWDR